jgi:hypothetical protein
MRPAQSSPCRDGGTIRLYSITDPAAASRFLQLAFAVALLTLLTIGGPSQAQDVLASPPAVSVTPPAMQQVQSTEMEVFRPTQTVPDVTQNPFLEWGLLSLRPHVEYRFLYGDGIQSSPGQNVKTAVNEISPGILLGIGSHWTLDYTPTMTFYSSRQFNDTTGQNVILTGGTTYEDWVFGLSQSYAYSSQPLIETAAQTSQDEYITSATASYQISRQLSLALAVNQDFTFPENYTESRDWSTLDWLDYQFWPRFSAGLGAGVGYTDVSAGDDSMHGQLLGRVSWRATDKLSLQANGGVDDRHYFGGGSSDLVNPIGNISVQYQPFETTQITLGGRREIGVSLFANQITETTTAGASLNQRLLKKLHLTIGGGYQNVKYTATSSGAVAAGREDNYYYIGGRLGVAFLKRGTVAATYQYSDNSSNQKGYGYSSNQVGVELSFRY